MIDIHTHILPDTDDGAQNLSSALEMARIAVADGVTHLVATPHHTAFGELPCEEVARRVQAFQIEVSQRGIPLTVATGHEVVLYERTMRDMERGLAGPLADSRYVLVESGFHQFGALEQSVVRAMISSGYIPILAHPERIIPIQQELSLIEKLIEHGMLVQVTAAIAEGAIRSGRFSRLFPGHHARTTALELLRREWVHILASDAHNTTTRRPGLAGARDAVAELIGEEKASAMVFATPGRVLGIATHAEPAGAALGAGQ